MHDYRRPVVVEQRAWTGCQRDVIDHVHHRERQGCRHVYVRQIAGVRSIRIQEAVNSAVPREVAPRDLDPPTRIAATNRDLEACMQSGAFRPDLFYRLSVFPIYLPPLRERREDIPALVAQLVRRFAERQHKPTPTLADGVMEQLLEHEWPGNVRELQNVLERAVILARNSVITADLLAIRRIGQPPAPIAVFSSAPRADGPSSNVLPFSEAERRAIVRALETTGWRISGRGGAADALGLKPTTLHAKMKRLGIHRPSAPPVDQT